MININYKACTYCLNCFKVCPLKVFDTENNKVVIKRKENCISCGHCVSVCPNGALEGNFKDSIPGKSVDCLDIPSFKQIKDLFLSRRSIRVYENRKVEKEKIKEILNIAAHAPTGRNTQGVKFFVVGKQGTVYLEKLAEKYFLNKKNDIGNIVNDANFKILLGVGDCGDIF